MSAKSRRKSVAAVLTAVLLPLALATFYFVALRDEDYCWFYPEIDTVFAADFSKARFAEVEAGMTKEKVIGLIGEPLGKSREKVGCLEGKGRMFVRFSLGEK